MNIKKGYTEFKDQFTTDWAEKTYQKRFFDEIGTKYFINVYKTKPVCGLKSTLTAKCQMETATGTIELQLFQFDDFDKMELFFEDAWLNLNADYYERD